MSASSLASGRQRDLEIEPGPLEAGAESQIIQAELTWTGMQFEPGIEVAIAPNGRIEAVGLLGRRPTRSLPNRALLPGLVNVHSHAFQRGLRGLGERFPDGTGSFWTWREAMYALVGRLDAEAFLRLCVQAFREMLDAGITTVGEFHYLHHSNVSADFAYDALVLKAAATAGIRMFLLNAYYAKGGVGQRLAAAQRRFETANRRAYWDQMDRLEASLDPVTQTLGAVAHSIRAVDIDDIVALHEEARRRKLVFHMHVEEQPREIEECLAAYGRRPMQLLNERLDIGGHFTAVHCTHTHPDDMARFLARGGRVCACPLTEANLGDGIPDLYPVQVLHGSLSLGTDSNARIGFFEEMRWLEYGQRLRNERRGLLADRAGEMARVLLEAATDGGAGALGVPAGSIQAGMWADFAVIDLGHPALAGYGVESLLDSIVFGAGAEVICGTAVGGRWRARGSGPVGL